MAARYDPGSLEWTTVRGGGGTRAKLNKTDIRSELQGRIMGICYVWRELNSTSSLGEAHNNNIAGAIINSDARRCATSIFL